MELQTAAVDSRIDDLRRLSTEIHVERDVADAKARRTRRSGGLRRALGLRLVAFGSSLLGELDRPAPSPQH